MANVKPQGRKNVNPQLMISFKRFPHSVGDFFLSIMIFSFFINNPHVGKLSDIQLSLGDILVKFTPSKSITIPMISVIIDIIKGDTLITEPKIPSIPHSIPNHTILHVLNRRCGMIFFEKVSCSFCLFSFADIAKTSHPTIAIQVENPAVNQISRTNHNDGVLLLKLKEKIPACFKTTYKKVNHKRLMSNIL